MTNPAAGMLTGFAVQLQAAAVHSIRRARRSPFGFVLSIVVVGVSLILPVFVLLNLDRGFELSDTGYYYVSIFHSDEIAMQTTQFAIVWQLLGLPDNIYLNRLTVFALLMAAGAALALNLTAYLQSPKRRGLVARPAYAALGAGAFALHYFWWLPDPSYNTLGLALNGFVLALFFDIARRLREQNTLSLTACVTAGAIGMALIYVRPPTAAFLAVAGAILILSGGGWRPRHLLRITVAAVAGALGFVLVISLLVEPFWETLSRIEGGFERREVLDRPGSFARSVSQYFTAILGSFQDHRLPFGPVGLALSAAVLGVFAAGSRLRDPRHGLILLALSGLAILALGFEFLSGFGTWPVGRDGWLLLGAVQIKVLLLAVVAGLGYEAFTRVQRSDGRFKPPAPASLAMAALLIAFAAQFVGTSNAWFHFSVVAFGLAMMLLLVPLALTRGRATPTWVVSILIVMGSAQFMVMHIANGSPYLLGASLTAQTITTPVGPGGSVLRLDREGHQLITEIQRAGATLNAAEVPPPVLLDMTGTVPGATYLLGARAPGVPWLNWSLPGSQQMFDNAVAGLSDDDFASAWVLYSPDWHRSLEADAFAARGRQVPDDYVEMGRAHLALRDIDILILAPRSDTNPDPAP